LYEMLWGVAMVVAGGRAVRVNDTRAAGGRAAPCAARGANGSAPS
jgi:hypothetical protein